MGHRAEEVIAFEGTGYTKGRPCTHCEHSSGTDSQKKLRGSTVASGCLVRLSFDQEENDYALFREGAKQLELSGSLVASICYVAIASGGFCFELIHY